MHVNIRYGTPGTHKDFPQRMLSHAYRSSSEKKNSRIITSIASMLIATISSLFRHHDIFCKYPNKQIQCHNEDHIETAKTKTDEHHTIDIASCRDKASVSTTYMDQ